MTIAQGDGTISVLYIDDDAALARLVQRYLGRRGYDVATAPDGAAGLAQLSAGHFDVVALDHFMPGEDGLELLKRLGELPDAPPAIYVTASDDGRVAVSALKQGAVDYVIKDVQGAFLDLLDQAILQAVAQSRTRRAKEAAERELRESRDRLAELLEQRTALLHEMTHRVSNSLQLIGSLISIQANRISDPTARDALLQARERVQAVMLVHRRLYTSDQIGMVEIDKYLHAMAEELQASVLAADREHRIEVSAAPLRITPDKAVSVGVIVNELVTNALKYAFPAGASGTIRVGLSRGAADQAVLTVEDDGVGYPQEPAAPKGTGLGALIIGAMAKTLHGVVERLPANTGSRTALSFPLN
jgi:two-component sensor histidine kinase/CheY-like chemotaxis protein